ncbi:maltase 1-like [Agrilus planipennis]|uniref:alpha-glucosidase n=1 Tax=Agrilus planipennis TaxID=224129 RepID=A0A1W4XFX4_AGRPL|nr:maltase 1-like [Agrilus planipennis]
MKIPICFGEIILFVISFLLGSSNSQSSEINWDWWRTAVIYQIYPKSFNDANNDGYGDLRGIISKLPHLADAGVNAAWISPIYASPQVDDGYDISNFVDVWETFGTLEDFDELVTASHELDIKIIMDLVPNHSSDQHDWFKLSENRTTGYEDYYVWRDGESSTTPPNNWISVFKYSAWKYSEIRRQWYLHQFTEQQPDLNYRNPKVLEEMTVSSNKNKNKIT